jgi:plastocyanin
MILPFFRGLLAVWLAAGFSLSAINAVAQVTVTDDGFSFTPDPVSITVGETVSFVDDGSGPYAIISDTGAWNTFATPGAILFSQTGTYGYHDDAGDFGTVIVSPNLPPSISITNPASNAVFVASANFAFSVDAYDLDADGLSDVKFYVGTNLVDDVFDAPYTTMVTNLLAGPYVLTAIAQDNLGATATNKINILVTNGSLSLSQPRITSGAIQFDISGLAVGKTNVLQATTNLVSRANWIPVATNVASSSSFTFTNPPGLNLRFFRVLQLP